MLQQGQQAGWTVSRDVKRMLQAAVMLRQQTVWRAMEEAGRWRAVQAQLPWASQHACSC